MQPQGNLATARQGFQLLHGEEEKALGRLQFPAYGMGEVTTGFQFVRGSLIDDLRIPLPRPSGLLLEKLLTDRGGEKGDRDLLVALALLLVCEANDLAEIEVTYRALPPEQRYAARSGLSTLSLLEVRPSMPDPTPHRAGIAGLLARLEKQDQTRE